MQELETVILCSFMIMDLMMHQNVLIFKRHYMLTNYLDYWCAIT